MRAARQPAETYSAPTIASAKSARVRFSVAPIKAPPGLTSAAERGEEGVAIGDVLDDFEREDDVEALAGPASASMSATR